MVAVVVVIFSIRHALWGMNRKEHIARFKAQGYAQQAVVKVWRKTTKVRQLAANRKDRAERRANIKRGKAMAGE
jgi:hypothetical protein